MEDIGGHLEFFQQLDHATRMLNHPGESLIFQADFLDMVNRVDICIEFLRSHVRTFGVAFKSFVLNISVATLPRSRGLSTPIPAMYDLRRDADQDEFRRVITRPLLRNFEKPFRKGRLADITSTRVSSRYPRKWHHCFASSSNGRDPIQTNLLPCLQNFTRRSFQRVRAFWYLGNSGSRSGSK